MSRVSPDNPDYCISVIFDETPSKTGLLFFAIVQHHWFMSTIMKIFIKIRKTTIHLRSRVNRTIYQTRNLCKAAREDGKEWFLNWHLETDPFSAGAPIYGLIPNGAIADSCTNFSRGKPSVRICFSGIFSYSLYRDNSCKMLRQIS